jgi:cold shock CspA family protein
MENKKNVGMLNKWFPNRGFGFIKGVSEHGVYRDYFVHATAIRKDSAEPIVGSSATFAVAIVPKGLVALDVKFATPTEITDAVIATLSTPVVQS